MSAIVRIITIIVGVLFIKVVLSIMKAKKLTEAQSIGWFIGGIILIILGIYPNLVRTFADFFGIWYGPTMVTIFAILLITFIVFGNTIVISRLSNQVNELTMQLTLLKDENITLNNRINNDGGDSD